LNNKEIPDTTLPPYNSMVKTPDLPSWDMWANSGTLGLYPYITEFIARSKKWKDSGDDADLTNS